MSATSTTPTTTTTSSTPSPSSSGINIPTTTVVAIGFGFVSFALGVFCLLLSIRAIKLYRQARASRWTDQPRTFRQVWRENGGVFGFFHGFNNAGNSIALGGGGRGLGMYGGVGIGLGMDEITRARLWNELGVYWDHDNRRWARVLHPGEGFVLGGGGEEGGVDGGKKPEMWEVAVGGAGRGGGTDEKSLLNAGPEEMRGMKNYIPLSVHTNPILSSDPEPPSTPPALRISLLIALPSPPPLRRTTFGTSPISTKSPTSQAASGFPPNGDGDGDEELPDLIVGSTMILPVVPVSLPQHRSRTMQSKAVEGHETERGDEKRKLEPDLKEEVDHVEHQHAPSGRLQTQGIEDLNEVIEGEMIVGGMAGSKWRRAGWVREKGGGWEVEGLSLGMGPGSGEGMDPDD